MELLLDNFGLASTLESIQLDNFGLTSTLESTQLDGFGLASTVEFRTEMMAIGIEKAEQGSFILVLGSYFNES